MTPAEERTKLIRLIDEYSQILWNKSYEEWADNNSYSDENPAPIEVLREYADTLYAYQEAQVERDDETPNYPWENDAPSERYRIKRLWKKAYEMSVHEQPTFCDMDYYTFIGQWFKENYFTTSSSEEDLRIHNIKIADSGTGKTESNNFMAEVVRIAQLTIEFPGRINDASIIGSYDKEIAERNRKKGRVEGDPDYEDPVIYGVLKNYDFVVFDEAERVLKPTGSTEQLQVTLQAAMNRIGSAGNIVSNTLVKGKVSYNSRCSIVMSSYYLEEIKETLVTKGLIQRMIFYNQEPSIDLRRKIERKIMDSIDNEDMAIGEISKQKKAIEEFVHELKSISKAPQKVRISKNIREKIIFYNEEMRLAAQYSPKGQRDIFNSILSRGLTKMTKLAVLNALSEGRNYVTMEDVEEMYPLIKTCNLSILEFISDNIETRMDKQIEEWLQDMQLTIGRKPLSKGAANELMMIKWKRGKKTVIERIKKLSEYYTIVDKEGVKYLQMK